MALGLSLETLGLHSGASNMEKGDFAKSLVCKFAVFASIREIQTWAPKSTYEDFATVAKSLCVDFGNPYVFISKSLCVDLHKVSCARMIFHIFK